MTSHLLQTCRAGAVALALLATGSAALARNDYMLRYFGLDTRLGASVNSGEDAFANGNPATGLVFQTPGGTVAGVYFGNSFTAGAELAGPAGDFLGQQFGLGGLTYRYGDSVDSTTNLTPSPYQSRSLSLGTANVPNTALGLIDRTRSFDIVSGWNFQTPAPGESMLLITGGTGSTVGSTGSTNYSDRLQIRLTGNYQTGQAVLLFEQQARQDGVYTRTALESHALNSLPVDLSQVDYLVFEMWRDAPTAGNANPAVHALVNFMDAAYDAVNDQPVILYRLTFAATGTSFVDGRFANVQNAVTWLSPDPAAVPEPAAAALLLAGLTVLSLRRRR